MMHRYNVTGLEENSAFEFTVMATNSAGDNTSPVHFVSSLEAGICTREDSTRQNAYTIATKGSGFVLLLYIIGVCVCVCVCMCVHVCVCVCVCVCHSLALL